MRKTIRRGLFVTATATFALVGFGLSQASATVPALPTLPASPTVPTAPAVPTLPGSGALPGLNSVDSVPLGGFTTTGLPRTDLPAGSGALPSLDALPALPALSDLPLSADGLPGLPGLTELPIGVEPGAMPALPAAPSTSDITKSPVADVPLGKLPVMAQIDHNDVFSKAIPSLDGVEVTGVPKPALPNAGTLPGMLKLPKGTPATPGMDSVAVPTTVPVVSDVDTTTPGVDSLTGGTGLPTLPLPAV